MNMKHPVELGVPVRAARGARTYAGRDADGNPCVYVVVDCDNGVQFLQVNPANGDCIQHQWPADFGGGGPTLWSEQWRRFFCYSGQSMTEPGQLIEFNPVTGAFTNHGRINSEKIYLPVSLDEAPDGTLYMGSYANGCGLTSFRPDTRQFRQFGTMAENEFYFYVACGADGTIAGLVKMAKPHVVTVNPADGSHKAIGPVADTDAQTGHVTLVKGGDGLLYIDSHEGIFALRGMSLQPARIIPPPPQITTLADGTTVRFADNRVINRTLELIAPNGVRRHIKLDYEAPGAGIYICRPGPDGKIYGSTALPLRLFRHDPATGINTDFGQCSTSSGEVYSMDSMAGKMYITAYTHALLCEYNLALPYTFNSEHPDHPGIFRSGQYGDNLAYEYGPDDNPRQLGRIDAAAYRPRDMCAGPAGKVWIVSIPDYGMIGGTLSWYDPRTRKFGGAHRHIIPDCSPISITHLKKHNLLALGFSIYGGSGTVPRTSKAGFALWDPAADKLVWRGDLGMEIVGVMDIEDAGNGMVYAIVHAQPENVLKAELMLLDLRNEMIVGRLDLTAQLGWPMEVSFQRDERFLYGLTCEGLYRVKLGTLDLEILWQDKSDGPGPSIGAGALCNGVYYFASGARLRAMHV